MIIKYWFLESRVHIKGPILCLLYSFVTVKNIVQSCGKIFFLDKNVLILCHKFSNVFFCVHNWALVKSWIWQKSRKEVVETIFAEEVGETVQMTTNKQDVSSWYEHKGAFSWLTCAEGRETLMTKDLKRCKISISELCRETWLSQYIFGFFFSLPVVIKETWRSQYIFVLFFSYQRSYNEVEFTAVK